MQGILSDIVQPGERLHPFCSVIWRLTVWVHTSFVSCPTSRSTSCFMLTGAGRPSSLGGIDFVPLPLPLSLSQSPWPYSFTRLAPLIIQPGFCRENCSRGIPMRVRVGWVPQIGQAANGLLKQFKASSASAGGLYPHEVAESLLLDGRE